MSSPNRKFAVAIVVGAVHLCVACSSSAPAQEKETDQTAPAPSESAAATNRTEFEDFFRMSLRQVAPDKLDCMIEELATTLSDARAAEFVETLSSGSTPPPSTLKTVSAAASACRAGSVI